MPETELDDLRRRAEAGGGAAMTAWGKRLLSGDGVDRNMPAGAAFVRRAAELGEAEALGQCAVFAAAGIGQAPSLGQALDYLQAAAERGWAPALEELQLLAGRDNGDPAGLRRAVDLAAWMKPPDSTIVFERPRVVTAQGLMSKRECERMIEKARPRLQRASVYDNATGGKVVVGQRSNSTAEMEITDADLPFVLLHARMSALLGLRSDCFEVTNILHYAPGQEFKPHFDFLYSDEPGTAADIARFGQRIVTLLIYLNDDYEGGETHFPRLNYAFKGRAGDALAFANTSAKGEPEPLSMHAGRPPITGEKWLLSQWVRNRPLSAPAR